MSDRESAALLASKGPSPKLVHAAVIHDGLWTPKCANTPGWTAPLARESGQVNCLACIGLIVTERLREPEQDLPHPKDCSCAIPCRRCGHQEEQHAGSVYGGTGPARCLVTGCRCKGRYIGDVAAQCAQRGTSEGGRDERA